jgi:hypothetical protein
LEPSNTALSLNIDLFLRARAGVEVPAAYWDPAHVPRGTVDVLALAAIVEGRHTE